MEKHLKSDGVFLDCEAQDIAEVNKVILDYLKDVTKLNEEGLEEVGIQLKAKNNHASNFFNFKLILFIVHWLIPSFLPLNIIDSIDEERDQSSGA